MKKNINLSYGREYIVWSLEMISNDDLWEVASSFQDLASRVGWQYNNVPKEHITSQNETGGAFFSVDPSEVMVIERPLKRLFLKKWRSLPKSFFLMDNLSSDDSAGIAIAFVKKLQEKYPKIAFEYFFEEPDMIVFDDDIQKINFVPTGSPVPEEPLPQFPEIGYADRYNVWCLDEVSADRLWEVVQDLGAASERFNRESEGEAYVRFHLTSDRGHITFAVWGKSQPVCETEEERVYFQNAWFAIPKSFFIIEHDGDEGSAALAIDFVKAFQKKYPRTALEYYSGFPDYVVFENNIQKLRFVSNAPRCRIGN